MTDSKSESTIPIPPKLEPYKYSASLREMELRETIARLIIRIEKSSNAFSASHVISAIEDNGWRFADITGGNTQVD